LSSEVVVENGPGQLNFSYKGLSNGGSNTLTNITLICSESTSFSAVDNLFDVFIFWNYGNTDGIFISIFHHPKDVNDRVSFMSTGMNAK
jgi:hypothetical protein